MRVAKVVISITTEDILGGHKWFCLPICHMFIFRIYRRKEALGCIWIITILKEKKKKRLCFLVIDWFVKRRVPTLTLPYPSRTLNKFSQGSHNWSWKQSQLPPFVALELTLLFR